MKIELTINFSPDVRYRVSDSVVCYFNGKHQMNSFLTTLDRISKKRYEYKWREIKTEEED